jgi:two-component system nitrate/nitrite response regulator NarL
MGNVRLGESTKIIARTCHIAEATVKIHLRAILRKLNAQNRTEAAIWADAEFSKQGTGWPIVRQSLRWF